MSELTDSAELLEAFSDEIVDYWPLERELLATLVEICHALLVVTLKANGAKRTPPPLRYPRPDAVTGEKAKPVPMSEYVQMLDEGKV